jgi:UDP-N-acetylmuramoyl-L-alanyl-D-glutamate--2,6-diaminopimelate ligase
MANPAAPWEQLISMSRRPERKLSDLSLPGTALTGDACITDIVEDSRLIQPGNAFLCLPRTEDWARDYALQARKAGASALILVGRDMPDPPLPCLKLTGMEQAGAVLRRWFGTESSHVKLVGITGTDGKTSITWMLRQALERLLGKAWSVGTLGWIRSESEIIPLRNTTPSLLTMHRLLAVADDTGVPAMVCEVSSHGIAQGRIAGLPFAAALWTNLGHDHLQDHGGFEPYARCKASFIRQTVQQGGLSIINADDEEVVQRSPDPSLRYGHSLYSEENDLGWEQELPGTLRIAYRHEEVVLDGVPIGEFHSENLAAVSLTLLEVFRAPLKNLPPLLKDIRCPPGRMQPVDIGPWMVFIDYAHTPEALERCLQAARTLTRNRLLLVFGCGGERDRAKRPQMGEIAVKLADIIWITSDNPRNEQPELIASEIVDGMPQPFPADVHLQLNREHAISEAIAEIGEGDVLIIAGKGHEREMLVENQRIPWNDFEVASNYLRLKNDATGWRACA